MKLTAILYIFSLFFLNSIYAQEVRPSIRIAADCAEPDDPKNYPQNQSCVRRAIRKTAKIACLNQKRSFSVKPAVSLSCATQGALYVCKGEAFISCDSSSSDIVTLMEDGPEAH